MKTLGIIFLFLVINIFRLLAAEAPFSDFPPEEFEKREMKDGKEMKGNDGKTYRVVNKNFQKGMQVKFPDGRWMPHGIQYEYANGKLISITHFQDGKKEGPYLKYTLWNGETVPETEGQYEAGKRTGAWKRYDRGLLLQEMTYENDKLVGLFTEYRLHGKLAGKPALEKNYKRGQLHGETRIYSSNTGNLIQSIFYNENMVIKKIWYNENSGQKIRETVFDGSSAY